MQTLIYNAWIVTMDVNYSEFHPGYILIEDDKIVNLGAQSELSDEWLNKINIGSTTNFECVDAQDGIVMPGMINAHTHVGMIPFRSLGDDIKDRLRRFLFPLEANFTEELVKASARYAMAEMLLAGITSFGDMYYFEDSIAEITDEMGMRALLGETIINQPSCDGDDQPYYGFKMMDTFINRWQGHPLIQPMIAPHAPNTNDEDSLAKIKAISQDNKVPVMMHVSEMDYEMEYYANEYQQTPVRFLKNQGLLNTYLIAVHCIHLTQEDIELLQENHVNVVHCIGANTKAAKGFAPLKQLLDVGVKVGLGTDGPSSGNTLDLFHQMRYIAYSHKTINEDRSAFPARDIVRLATVGGAQVLGLDHKVGQLVKGYQADITLIETHSVNMFPIFDPYSAIVYSANASNVSDVWVNGCHLVANKTLKKYSVEELRFTLENQMQAFREDVKTIESK